MRPIDAGTRIEKDSSMMSKPHLHNPLVRFQCQQSCVAFFNIRAVFCTANGLRRLFVLRNQSLRANDNKLLTADSSKRKV